MIKFGKYFSATLEAGRRFLKVQRLGNNDVQTPRESMPFGVDSVPLDREDFVAIVAESSEKGKPVVIGYINRNQIAQEGEMRIFSLKNNGQISQFIHLKGDETIEFGGNSDNLVRFSPLSTALNNQATAINAELIKIQTAITGLGGAYARANVSINISGAKIEEFKSI